MDSDIPFLSPFSEEWIVSYTDKWTSLIGGLSTRNVVFEVDQKKYVLHTLENDFEWYMMNEAAVLGVPLQY